MSYDDAGQRATPRQQFEVWIKSFDSSADLDRLGNFYQEWNVQRAWAAWQVAWGRALPAQSETRDAIIAECARVPRYHFENGLHSSAADALLDCENDILDLKNAAPQVPEAARPGAGVSAHREGDGLSGPPEPVITPATAALTETRAGIVWHEPSQARTLLADDFDETGAVDSCVVKLDVTHKRHDGGPYLRQAWYDRTQDGFVCAATGTTLHNVLEWAYDEEGHSP